MSDYKSCHYFENNDLQMNNKLSKIWEKIPKNHSEWDFFFFFLDEVDYCKKSWKDPKNHQNVTVKAHGTTVRLYYTLWNKLRHIFFFI